MSQNPRDPNQPSGRPRRQEKSGTNPVPRPAPSDSGSSRRLSQASRCEERLPRTAARPCKSRRSSSSAAQSYGRNPKHTPPAFADASVFVPSEVFPPKRVPVDGPFMGRFSSFSRRSWLWESWSPGRKAEAIRLSSRRPDPVERVAHGLFEGRFRLKIPPNDQETRHRRGAAGDPFAP